MEIVQVESPQHLQHICILFTEYFRWLEADQGLDMSYQSLQAELISLPGYYSPPQGRLLLALNETKAAGCVAFRPLEEGVCEMKRMYIRPEYRGLGLGRLLGEKVIEDARQIGYRLMRLDTADFLTAARTLYKSLGFREVPPYYEVPPDVLVWTIFMERPLQ